MAHIDIHALEPTIEHFFALGPAVVGNSDALNTFELLREALELGTLRSASPDATSPTGWRVNAWVKRGILLGFRLGTLEKMNGSNAVAHPALSFVDKSTYPRPQLHLPIKASASSLAAALSVPEPTSPAASS